MKAIILTVIIMCAMALSEASAQTGYSTAHYYAQRYDVVDRCGPYFTENTYDALGNYVGWQRVRWCQRAQWHQAYGAHQVWLWGYNGWYTEWRTGYYYWYTWYQYKSY